MSAYVAKLEDSRQILFALTEGEQLKTVCGQLEGMLDTKIMEIKPANQLAGDMFYEVRSL